MNIKISRTKDRRAYENLVYLMSEEDAADIKKIDFEEPVDKVIKEAICDGDFLGKKDQLAIIRYDSPKRIILSGLGEESRLNEEKIRRAVCNVVKKLKDMKITKCAVQTPDIRNLKSVDSARAIVDGAILGDYEFSKYKTEKSAKIEELTVIYTHENDRIESALHEAKVLCENVVYVRNLVNENSDVKNPQAIAEYSKNLARKYKLKATILDEKDIRKQGMNLILAVAQGSRFPPQFIILEYTGNKKDKKRYALVGKGITFDSGGLNLKVAPSPIETMKSDMAGAATILGVMKSLAELKMKKNVIGIIPCCENMISQNATKPGSIVKSYSGKTVEIVNTDAEGRLILADALAYTEKNFKSECVIDLATLTGAILRTFGEYVAGMMTTDKEYSSKLFEAGKRTYERVWELPLYEEYYDEVKSDFADVPNMSYTGAVGSYAGSIMGAVFLNKFIEKTPWIHLDIAGTAWAEKTRYYNYHGGTGFGVRLLVDFFKCL